MMNSNVNMIQGDFRHMDRSTTITNRDAFNIESTVTEQQLPPTASLIVGNDASTTMVSPDPSTAHYEHDTDSNVRPVEMISSVHNMANTSHVDVDERESICTTAPIKKNGFTSVCKKVKRWFKREL